MGRHGENIRKRKDGRWEARYQVFALDKGRKMYRSVYGSSYEEAKGKRAAIQAATEKEVTGKRENYETETGHSGHRADIEPKAKAGRKRSAEYRGKNKQHEINAEYGAATEHRPEASPESAAEKEAESHNGQILFSQAAAEWLNYVSDKCKYSTYVKYGNIYRIYLEGIIGSCPLFDTSNQKFQEKLSCLLSEDSLSDSIRRSICCISNQILNFVSRNYSVTIPAVKFALAKSAKKPVRTFSKDEQSRLLAYTYNELDKYKVAILLCLYTGMRLGELCALRWTDFDFQDRTVTVSRTVQRIAVKGYVARTILMETDPKSECSKRTIPLVAEVVQLVRGIKGDQPYVFGGDKPLEPRTMQYRFRRILKEAEVEDRNFHILRHTFATNCIESEMDVKVLSMVLGHSDVKITLNRYVHPTMESRRRQMDRLPDFYGQIRGQAA